MVRLHRVGTISLGVVLDLTTIIFVDDKKMMTAEEVEGGLPTLVRRQVRVDRLVVRGEREKD